MRVLTEFLPPALFGRYKLALAGLSLVSGVLVRPFIQYAMRAYHDAAARGAGTAFLAHSRRRFGRYAGGLGLAAAAGGYLSASGGLDTAPAWAFAWPLMVAGSLAWLLHESDRFILGYFHGSAAVGLYAAAYGLVAAPFTTAAGAVAQVMYPVVFAASARRPGSSVLPGPMLAGTLLLGVGGVLVVWWWGDRLAGVVLAEGYRAGASGLLPVESTTGAVAVGGWG